MRAWLFVCDAFGRWCCASSSVGRKALPVLARDWKAGLFTGVLSGAAYWIVMWAMTKAPIASVASLRETSILFAMMISVYRAWREDDGLARRRRAQHRCRGRRAQAGLAAAQPSTVITWPRRSGLKRMTTMMQTATTPAKSASA